MTAVNRKTVMFLCDYKSCYGGNFIPSLLALEGGLAGKGYGCVYVLPEAARGREWVAQMQARGCRIEFLDFGQSRRNMIRAVGRLMRLHGVSILHVHFGQVLNMELLSLLRRDVKVFVHLHSDFSGGKRKLRARLVDWIQYRLLSARIHFLSVSRALAGVNPGRTTWIPNGLAVERIPCAHRSGAMVRAENHISGSEFMCLMFGWSPDIKGVDIAARAVRILNERDGLPVKLGIVCGREVTRDKMVRYVARHTGGSGAESYYVYLEPVEDVFAYHEAADLLLSASRSEGFSYALLEALSLGKKCVVSDIPGVSWAMAYPVVFPFASEDAEACAAAVKRALEQRTSEAERVSVGRAIREAYSIDGWVNAVLKCYESA